MAARGPIPAELKPESLEQVIHLRTGGSVLARIIPERPGYAISRWGRVYSRVKPVSGPAAFYDAWKELAQMNTGSRRQYKTLYLGLGYRWDIHRLVMHVFIGPCPAGHDVRHLNGDPADNRLENLAYGTRKENMADAQSHGTMAKGERNGTAVLTSDQVKQIRELRSQGLRLKEVAGRFGVSMEIVSQIARGTRWGWLT